MTPHPPSRHQGRALCALLLIAAAALASRAAPDAAELARRRADVQRRLNGVEQQMRREMYRVLQALQGEAHLLAIAGLEDDATARTRDIQLRSIAERLYMEGCKDEELERIQGKLLQAVYAFIDRTEERTADSPRWPSGRSDYATRAAEELQAARRSALVDYADPDAFTKLLQRVYRVSAWTLGRADVAPDEDPFRDWRDDLLRLLADIQLRRDTLRAGKDSEPREPERTASRPTTGPGGFSVTPMGGDDPEPSRPASGPGGFSVGFMGGDDDEEGDPDDAGLIDKLLREGDEFWEQQNWDKGEWAYAQAISRGTRAHRAFYRCGQVYGMRKDWEAAEKKFRRANELNPDDASYEGHLALSLWQQGKFREAEDVINRAIRRRPDLPNLHYQRGHIALRQQRWAEAEGNYRKAISIQPDHAPYYLDLGLAQLEQGKIAEARQAADRARQLGRTGQHSLFERLAQAGTPDVAAPDFTCYNQSFQAGDLQGAYTEIQRLGAQYPRDYAVQLNLGVMHLLFRSNAAAVEASKRLLAAYPNDVEALLLGGKAAYWTGDQAGAKRLFTAAMQVDPNLPATVFGRGRQFYQAQQWHMAFQEFVTVLQLGGSGAADAHYWLARVYEQLQDPANAVQQYRAFLQAQPNSPWAPQARAAIQRLSAPAASVAPARSIGGW